MIFLVLVTVFGLADSGVAQKPQLPECTVKLERFYDCLRNNSMQTPPAMDELQDEEAMRKELDECYPKSGCGPFQLEPDKFEGQDGWRGRVGPPPRRLEFFARGRVTDDGPTPCDKKVTVVVYDQFMLCMESKDPDFPKDNQPSRNGLKGFPLGYDLKMEEMEIMCNGDKTKVKRLKKCLDDVDAKYDTLTKAKQVYDCGPQTKCKKIYGNCGELMMNRYRALCECQLEMNSVFDDAFKKENSCAGVERPPKFQPTEAEFGCGIPPTMCDEEFE